MKSITTLPSLKGARVLVRVDYNVPFKGNKIADPRRIDAKIVVFNETHYSIAADAYLRFGRGYNSKANLNFGDCLAYSVARLTGEPLLFVGDDFVHTDILSA